MEAAPLATTPASERKRFRIVKRLARGGMAEVLLAEQAGLSGFRRYVVLKRILPHLARQPEYVAMLLDEARITGSLNHPNIAQVFDVVQWQGHQFLVMEFLHGKTTGQVISAARRGNGLAMESALSIVGHAAHGLHAAHECKNRDNESLGVVHRDVSPSNVFVTFDGHVKVLDFGIALASSRTTETASGVLKGKVAYMSPEQCRGNDLDRRSDVYSLGVLLYEILTLTKLRGETSDFEAMQKIVAGAIRPPSSVVSSIPEAIDEVVMRGLALEREDRYPTCAEFANALEAAGSQSGFHPRSSLRIAGDMIGLFGEVPPAWGDENPDDGESVGSAAAEQASAIIEGLGPEIAVGDDLDATSLTATAVPSIASSEGPLLTQARRRGHFSFGPVAAVLLALCLVGVGGWWLATTRNSESDRVSPSDGRLASPEVSSKQAPELPPVRAGAETISIAEEQSGTKELATSEVNDPEETGSTETVGSDSRAELAPGSEQAGQSSAKRLGRDRRARRSRGNGRGRAWKAGNEDRGRGNVATDNSSTSSKASTEAGPATKSKAGAAASKVPERKAAKNSESEDGWDPNSFRLPDDERTGK